MRKEFQAIIEKDNDGYLIADVPALKGCHTQARSYDELMVRIKEAIELCLEVQQDFKQNEFIGLQKVLIDA